MYLAECDAKAVFLNESGEMLKGRQGLREVFAPLAAAKTKFDFSILQIIPSGDIVLMHTRWRQMSSPQPTSMHAVSAANHGRRTQTRGTHRASGKGRNGCRRVGQY